MDGIKSVDLSQYLTSADELIEEARNGRMFILVDDEDRENEGDLVIPGAVRHAGGGELHGSARAWADLPGADAAAGGAARSRADERA